MHRFAPVALATLLAATVPALLCAQAPTPFTVPAATGHFTDPANLAGERVRPRDGRELPIDGGLGLDGQPDNALGLAQMLRRLNTRASLMLIVAHPDDEDGGMLTYYSRGLGARVAILTLNRGEGGQNQMTGDFEDALGLLRTQELLSADRYMGVTQMFGTEVDFGFTKTKQEAFQKWNHQRVLYDAVRAVRIYRPLIIASTFEGAVTDGHGQHQVSGEIAQEVFKAAGDPNVFPELTKEGILPWQPLKVFARVPFSRVSAQGLFDYATGQTVPAEFTNYVTGQKFTTEPTPDVTINEGQTDPLLTYAATDLTDLRSKPSNLNEQLSYVQFARIGLGLQRSQIGGGMRLPRPGRSDVSYHLYGSRVCAPNLPNPTPDLCSKTASITDTPGDGSGAPPSTRSAASGRVGYRAARGKSAPQQISVILSEGSHPGAANSNAVILSDRSAAKGVEEPRGSQSDHNRSSLFHLVSQPTRLNEATEKAPTARSITAQGNALGSDREEEPSAEGAPYNPALANQPNFFDGIDTSLTGIATLAPDAQKSVPVVLKTNLAGIAEKVESAQKAVSAGHADYAANDLATALTLANMATENLSKLNPDLLPATEKENVLHELRIKRTQLNDALVLAVGLSLNAELSDPSTPVVTGKSFKAIAILRSPTLTAGSPSFRFNDLAPAQQNEATSLGWGAQATATIPAPVFATVPYFNRPNIERPFYDVQNPELRLAPQTPPPFVVWATVDYRGTKLHLAHTINAPSTPPDLSIPSTGASASQLEEPVQVVAPGSIFLSSHAQVLPNSSGRFEVTVTGRPAALINEDTAWTGLPKSWKLSSAKPSLEAGAQRFTINAPKGGHEPVILNAAFTKADGTLDIEGGFRSIGYGDLPRTNYYTPATLRVIPVDLKLPPANKRRIAYLPGTGDDVPAALASIGLTPTILKVSDLTPDKLSHFDTVVLGVRTYNAHPDLHGAPTQALFDFARNGGNVLVQYQTNEFSAADAPYPLELHGERVIDETAPVKLLEPEASRYPEPSGSGLSATSKEKGLQPLGYALLNVPNKITPADFNNWIEERGHGFLDSWDPHYTALTETHDPGSPSEHVADQAPQRGGLITTQLGKGRWTYCAFALYRQLPEAVPGAFRLFVNLLNP